jgi:hypothetical protein
VARTRQFRSVGIQMAIVAGAARTGLLQPRNSWFRSTHCRAAIVALFLCWLGEKRWICQKAGLHGRGRCQNNPCEVHLNWDTKFFHERHLLRATHFGLVLSDPPFYSFFISLISLFFSFLFLFFFLFNFYYRFLVLENSWSPRVSPFSSSPPPRFRFHNVCLCPCDRNSLSNTLVVVMCPCMLIHSAWPAIFQSF